MVGNAHNRFQNILNHGDAQILTDIKELIRLERWVNCATSGVKPEGGKGSLGYPCIYLQGLS